ncbi:MAG: bis(5'-nucleosyl)-tetraphosphatase (symmetrical) YqeK [Lachnospiraceae bacterium]|nr:bis(5'-nucleosyl)-tetraphosphatase (symmetrical) YqeK [Lachnospiraceae bacterium]
MDKKTKYNYGKIRKKLEAALDPDRFEHTLGVAVTARMLARIYGADEEAAYTAGLLHDCAKNVSHKDKIKMCEKADVCISETEMANPGLLHAKAGAILAKKEYDIEDEDILNAISSHTTGRPGMSLLEKIIFVADYIEPGRDERPELMKLRKEAFDDLDKCVIDILEATLKYLTDTAKAIDPATSNTYDYYLNNGESDE